ncbi:MAG: hypothetical protein LBR55_03040 [Bacteroidales bacterium]|jgi:tetratricopeptide (TPR) repeat protein|nr:hypothetical protein [Bacteroidales bacterium]
MKKLLLYIILFLGVSAVHAQKPRSKVDSVKQELKTLEVEKLLVQANLSKNNSDFHRALELYDAVISIDKTSAVAYYEMAGLLMYSKAFTDAVQYAQKAVQYNPLRVEYVERLAQVYMLQGNQKKLQETLRQLEKLEKSAAYDFRKQAIIETGKPIDAQVDVEIITTTSYEQLLQNPTNETIYEILTKNYTENEPILWDSIALVNEMAIQYFPGTAKYYIQAAQAHIELTHYEKAMQLLNDALEYSFVSDDQRKEIDSLLAKAKELKR